MKDSRQLATLLFDGMRVDTYVNRIALITIVYGVKSEEGYFLSIFNKLRSDESWDSLHKVTPEKAKLGGYKNNTWLKMAAEAGELIKVNELIQGCANNISQPNNKGATPLYIASHKGHHEVVKALLEAGADASQTWNGIPPLFIAAQMGYLAVVKAPLKAGADVNQTWSGATPLLLPHKMVTFK